MPAPGGGTINDVVETAPASPTKEVGLDEKADVGAGVTAWIEKVRSISVTAKTPGEIAGPAVAVELSVHNGGDEPIDLSSAMVSLTSGDDLLGQPTTSDPYAPFSGSLDADETASATYVFLLPEESRSDISVSIQYVAGAPTALFAEQN